MRIQIKYILLIISFLLVCKVNIAQENFAKNVSSSVSDGEKLLISYDITGNSNAKIFSVVMMITSGGKQVKASSVYGDVGSNIQAGNEKAIVWYYKNDFDGDIKNVTVDIYAYKENEPQAIFKIYSISNNGYAPCELVFSNSSSYANEYQWDFGDTESGSLNYSFKKEPLHVYKKGGVYSIALTARNTQLHVENKYYQSIEIKSYEKTVADFIIDGNNQLPPAKVQFINKSINADVFQWDFGDPLSKSKNVSTKKDAKHKYSNAGTFTVRLIAKSNYSKLNDTITKEVVLEQKLVPEAKFLLTKSSEVVPSTVVFKNMSTGGTNYKWNFGDPTSGDNNVSEDTDPAHTYTKPGTYQVELLTYGMGQKKPSRITEMVTINALPKPPKAKYSITNNNVLGPATIIFSNSSVNAKDYKWDFGDPASGANNESDKVNPTHTYKNAGTYKVVLTVTNEDFKEVSTYSDNVIVTRAGNPPVAKFTIQNNNATAPAEISFTNLSENADSYSWSFGDTSLGENTSTEKSPKHRYTKEGRYKVVLTVRNTKTGEESLFSDNVKINKPAKPKVKPVASFSLEKTTLPSPAIVSFTNKSSNANSFLWDFGDSKSADNSSVLKHPTHVYSSPGKYTVVLKVTDDAGETEQFTSIVTVTEPPKPTIQPVAKWSFDDKEMVAPASVSFTNKSSDADTYEWDFGDSDSPDNTSAVANPTHTFKNAGSYNVKVTVTNTSSGLSSSFSNLILISAPAIIPVANFEIQSNGATSPATVIFTDKSTNADSYSWNFGDPSSGDLNVSDKVNPQHIFKNSGEYNVILTVTNKDSDEKVIVGKTVVVNKPIVPPVANFESTIKGEFAPLSIEFKNNSTNADMFVWDFGDRNSEENSSSLEAPNHYYKTPGTYKITLEAGSSLTDIKDTISKEVVIKSSVVTFIKSKELPGNNKTAYSIARARNDEFFIVLGNLKNKSTIVKMNNKGDIVGSKQFDNQLFDIIAKEKKKDFFVLGVNSSGKLFVQNINQSLKVEDAIVSKNYKKFKTNYAAPKFALGTTNEIGIIANTINDKYPINLMFEKTDVNGNPIVLSDRTFKYIGVKLANDIIPVSNGGFCITGFWQKDSKTLKSVLFSRINEEGRGEIHLISGSTNSIGFDIEESYQNGYAILRAKENFEDKNKYELSFIIINKDGSPTDCASSLPCYIRKEDILKYKPTLLKTEDGYLIVSHAFNGADYDVKLLWFDTSGNILVRLEEIKLPGNQFVTDAIQTSDGGLLIVGTSREKNNFKAMVIKTDSLGKIY